MTADINLRGREPSLDLALGGPAPEALRHQAHRMLDDILDHMASLADGPVWRAPPPASQRQFEEPVPVGPTALGDCHQMFLEHVLPFGGGNAHPGFMGWVQGAGTPVGMLAEMLAAGLNANLGGRDHMPIAVERQVVEWMRQLFGFPKDASGLFVTGTSQANFLALLIARTRAAGLGVRRNGLGRTGQGLRAYASEGVHGCVPRAMDMAGIGADALRRIPVDANHRMNLAALQAAIVRDRHAGDFPFLVIGSAGTVNVGAVDDLGGIADIAAEEGLTFHVDGALGALAILSPELAPRLAGIERCDSLAFDFHKWGQVPYDAGFLLVRNSRLHRATFASDDAYLSRAQRGMAAGDWWPCDYGQDLSRGFRALKTWFTLKTYGTAAIGRSIARTCDLAQQLARRIELEPDLTLAAPVALNIVCFSLGDGQHNGEIVADLQEAGQVAPSLTIVNGLPVIRAAIVNHRTTEHDIDRLVDAVLSTARARPSIMAS